MNRTKQQIGNSAMATVLSAILERYPMLNECTESLMQAFSTLAATFSGGGKLLVCGNGGSAADSDHIVGELMKGFLLPRRVPVTFQERLMNGHPVMGPRLAEGLQQGLPAIALGGSTALLTAIANDNGAEFIYAQQVYGLGCAGDTLLGISTSGNAQNVLYAVEVAQALGMHTIGLTGRSGGMLASRVETAICVPADNVVAIQELHLPIYHALCAALEAHFFTESNKT